MPHVDGLSMPSVWSAHGQSRFARPVAAITAIARRAGGYVVTIFEDWREQAPQQARGRKELEVRQLEEHFTRATDRHDLERMEREWDRRDGGGMRNWDWR
jgi:hypothetical protein